MLKVCSRVLLFSVYVFSFLFFVLVFSLGIRYFYEERRKRSDEINSSELETRQYLRIGHEENEYSFGLLDYPNDIFSEGDESSFFDGENEHLIISEIGKDVYQCKGSCYCEISNRRSKSIPAVSRGLTYLLTAVSTLVAYDAAKDYFDEECHIELEKNSDCPIHSIRSEVGDCRKLDEIQSEISKKRAELNELEKLRKQELKKLGKYEYGKWFICSGRCFVTTASRDPERVKLAKDFGCEKLRLEGYDVFLESYEEGNPYTTDINKVKYKFQTQYLHDFCRENSVIRAYHQSPSSSKSNNKWDLTSLCTEKKKKSTRMNPSIVCIEKRGHMLFSDD